LLIELSSQKNLGLKTVVNKLDSIDSEFRVFKMEVLAGDDDFIAEMASTLARPFRLT
jgi:tRNA (guanine37-N1)-methyltransferase